MDKQQIKQEILTYGKLCYERGLVSAAGGNISMRLGDRMFISATNAPLRRLTSEDIVELDMDGNLVGDNHGRKPSKEWGMHLAVFKARPGVDSVIHTHPVYSIASSIAFLDNFNLPTESARLKLRKVGHVSVAKPGSDELRESVTSAVQAGGDEQKVVLLQEHGIIAYEKGMEACFSIAELMEETAHINYLAATLKTAAAEQGELF